MMSKRAKSAPPATTAMPTVPAEHAAPAGVNLLDTILGAVDIKREAVEVPEWGVTVYVKQMNVPERLAWANVAYDDEGDPTEHFRERLLIHTLVDQHGAPVFTDEHAEPLSRKNGKVIFGLFLAAKRLNLLDPEHVATAVKNS